MKKQSLVIGFITVILFLYAGPGLTANNGQIYGSQLMTEQERMEYRDQLRNAKTIEERQQIRKEHHEKMKERAKAQGKTLPDEPPAMGGMGLRDGSGKGGGGGGKR